jgi:hypothetical protein
VIAEPFFVPDGGRFVATQSTRGPWSRDHQHGGPPAALCVRALEALAGDGAVLARLTVDFLRPVPIAPVTVHAEITRAGRKVQRLRAALRDAAGDDLLNVTGVALRVAPSSGAAVLDADGAPPPPDAATPFTFPFFRESDGYDAAVEARVARGTWGQGRLAAWMRPRVPLVAGEVASALQSLVVVADSASGLAVVLDPARHSWVNADLTVVLHRHPVGEWFCLDAATTAEAHGVGLTRARLWDVRGPVGGSAQTLVLEARAS